jgi:hypothetical protein
MEMKAVAIGVVMIGREKYAEQAAAAFADLAQEAAPSSGSQEAALPQLKHGARAPGRATKCPTLNLESKPRDSLDNFKYRYRFYFKLTLIRLVALNILI